MPQSGTGVAPRPAHTRMQHPGCATCPTVCNMYTSPTGHTFAACSLTQACSHDPTGQCRSCGPSVPNENAGDAEADRAARNGGWMVPLPSWVRLLALWCGREHAAEFRGTECSGCSSRRRPDPECQGKGDSPKARCVAKHSD